MTRKPEVLPVDLAIAEDRAILDEVRHINLMRAHELGATKQPPFLAPSGVPKYKLLVRHAELSTIIPAEEQTY